MPDIDSMLSRNTLFFSKEKLDIIRKANIAVAGVGGLGCVVSEIMARLGVKNLTLVDNGIVDEPDLGRQSLYDLDDIGKRKVDAAKEKLLKKTGLNDIDTLFCDVGRDDLSDVLNNKSGIIDCLDNYKSRFALEKYLSKGQFLVHAGVEKDFGQITTIVKNKTPKLYDIYINIEEKNEITAVSTVSVFVMAGLMAQEIVNNILGHPQLVNRMLIVELSDFSFTKIDLR